MQNFNLKSKDFDKSTKDTTDNNYIVPAKVLMLNKETNHYLVTLQINSIRFNKSKKGIINITYADANYLVKIK